LGADEYRTPPVYNYARLFHWTAAVEAVHSGFSEAARRAAEHMPVEGTVWVAGDGVEIKPENRRGSLENVSNYIGEEDGRGFRISSGVIFRILASSVFALLLTWGTISAAMIIEYLTPTIGMFCFPHSFAATYHS
jgi:acylphosphatase